MATHSILTTASNQRNLPRVGAIFMLFAWITAGVGIVLPFAVGTSPLDALLLRVPNNEGNWWHALVGLPFFLSLPMIWLHLRILISVQPVSLVVGLILRILIMVSAFGTLLVETPFILHRAGTSELQRLEVIFSGLGIILTSAIYLFVKRNKIDPIRADLIGTAAAYLANAFLCLIIYGEAKFGAYSRSGWYLTVLVVVPIMIELLWLLFAKMGRRKDI